jgi:uncharacterized protein YgbK (DUF1537 family)
VTPPEPPPPEPPPPQSPPPRIALVADDLTGAADSAVQFAGAGCHAHLLRGPSARLEAVRPEVARPVSARPEAARPARPEPACPRPVVLAVATDVRAADDDLAAQRTAAAVRELLAGGCDRLYLKIDSTMRGSVAGQLRGALDAWSQTHADAVVVLCPAYPDQARTVVGGELRVGDVPVTRTAAAADPVTPVRESRLERLVPGAVATTPGGLAAAAGGPARVLFTDAATDADLDAVADAVHRLGPGGVAAGSAGLAAAMARRWSAAAPAPAPPAPVRTGRILVAVSSRHPLALSSVERLRATLPAPGRPAPGRPPVDVITTPQAGAATVTEVAADFGDEVAAQLRLHRYDALVLVGGDGAAAALDRVGATAVTLHTTLAPGIPIGTVAGGAADGLRVVTKSGGFGDAGSLVEIVALLQRGAPRKEGS